MPGEIEIIDRLRRLARVPPDSDVRLGIGDDCAIFRPRRAQDLLFTTDLLLEDVHFRRVTHRPEDAGHKALARGLSDIAAMGGAPRFCLVSLAAPAEPGWIGRFYRGLLRLARRTGTVLAGGDLAQAPRVACDIVVCGAVPRGRALRRDGARPGDEVWVSGRLGGSALGLATGRGKAWRRHLRPEPRLALGAYLRTRLRATACMDLSDGLSLDLRRLCLASGVVAEIEPPPVFPGATVEQALHGGEDYELLFTVRPGTRVPDAFESIPLARIGAVRAGAAGKVLLAGQTLEPGGWDHFRA